MRLSEHWLKEWVPGLQDDAVTLGKRLTTAGLELDSLESAAPTFIGVKVARVRTVESHPEADRLRVCQVDDGSDELVQVVCGAANVSAGMYVPFASVGAVLPGNLRIKSAKLRGVQSNGMLCSAAELGLAESSDGLMPLPGGLVLGSDLREALDLDDHVLEIDLTPNRADCLSVVGVARELAGLTAVPMKLLSVENIQAQCEKSLEINVVEPGACPRYLGRAILGINPDAEAPLWLRERLRRCGIRSISAVVDIINYVMLEQGQPMHAFDLSRITGSIHVRKAKSGESISLLNEQVVELNDDILVIADDHAPVAVAGIMGGDLSAVADDTVDIFLESAFFSPESIAGRARGLGLHTESSHRFERGVDPTLQRKAIERVTALILEIAGGKPGPISEACSEPDLPIRSPINLRRKRIGQILGIGFEDVDVVSILEGLGCNVDQTGEGWLVVPPAFRFDLSIEVDLIEELARVRGYDNIPERRSSFSPVLVSQSESSVSVDDMKALLCARGYSEAITYSFIDESLACSFAPKEKHISLSNPLSAELAVMRPSLWPGLIKALLYNANRQQNRGRLYETGLRFLAQSIETEQEAMISGAVFGADEPAQWSRESREIDFFDIKGDVEALFALGHRDAEIKYIADEHPALHPGQSARIECSGETLGWLGMLHPDLEKKLGMDRPVGLFELRLAPLCEGQLSQFQPLSRFPATRRDLAVVVDEGVTAGELVAIIRQLGIKELQELQIFDIYTGDAVPVGRKSIAFGLILQGLSSSLTDQEIETITEQILKALRKGLGATPRG